MDNLTSMGAVSHRLELYTDTLVIQGSVFGPFKRASDLLNRGETDFLAVHKATITPLGQPPSTKVMDSPVMVGRSHIHVAVDLDAANSPPLAERINSGAPVFGREAYIRKQPLPVYAITGTYVISGVCHLLQEAQLENMLRGAEAFIPITQATFYLVARPTVTWQRAVAIVSRDSLSVMYQAAQVIAGAAG